MDVFVIPVGSDRFELYYEQQIEETEPDAEPASTGIIARFQRRFSELLREAEEHGDEEKRSDRDVVDAAHARPHDGLDRQARDRAAAVVESSKAGTGRRRSPERYGLRRRAATHPAVAAARLRAPPVLARRRYHRVDRVRSAGHYPGPNLIAYYFLFRVGGHWLSMRGASQGRRRVQWESRPCDALNELRGALEMPRRERHLRVHQIASSLHLRHLPTFFERVTAKKTG